MTAQCKAIDQAMKAKGCTSAELAGQVGLTKQRVDDILEGKEKPSQQEFNSIAQVLGISAQPAHAANVVA